MLSRWLNGLPQLNMNSNPSAFMREDRFVYAGVADGMASGLHNKQLPIVAGGQNRLAISMGEMRLFVRMAFTGIAGVFGAINASLSALPCEPPRFTRGGVGQIDILTISGGLRQLEAGIFGTDDADGYEGIGINARGNEVARGNAVAQGYMVEQIVNNRIRHSHVGSHFRRKLLG